MIGRIRRALKLLTAVESLECRLKCAGTPYTATIRFDQDSLGFEVEYGDKRATGWPLASVIERL